MPLQEFFNMDIKKDPTEDNRYNEYLWVKDETYPDGH